MVQRPGRARRRSRDSLCLAQGLQMPADDMESEGAAGAVDRQGTLCLAEGYLLSLRFGVKIRSRFFSTEDSENW